jgi:hypothetical protein
MLLPTSIIANSTTQNCRRSPFFNRLRKEKWGPQKTNHSDRFLQVRVQARAHQYLTPKEQFFDMPSFLKYGSTGRPPGKFHIRHSPKKITENLESPSPPFDIFSIEKINNNNNNNIICYYDNGGIICNKGVLVDSKAATPATINYKTSAEGISTEEGEERLADRFESNRSNYKYKYKFNIDGISNTTPAPATMAEGISNEGGKDTEAAAGLSEWFANRFESNRCNYKYKYKYKVSTTTRSNYKYKYKFNIDGISTTTPAPAPATMAEGISNEGGEDTEAAAGLSEWFANRFESNRCNYKYKYKYKVSTTTTTIAPATHATATINYKTSAEGIPNEGGEEAEAAAGLVEWFANLFESNRCNSISNNNSKSNTIIFLFKLISLYLIITKSFPSEQFTKEPKEKHHHHQQQQQEHYHAKDRHQFHLEQQQKHQYFKQEQHNMERMVTSIVLKLSLVAWDMWAFRNVF